MGLILKTFLKLLLILFLKMKVLTKNQYGIQGTCADLCFRA
uniref:Uncharacterized protein n=1 Tax=Anguilla anguilla TaxID=7936 RepID=A0A0E9VR49_ANGAN